MKLWVRRPVQKKPAADSSQNLRSWFTFNAAPSLDDQSFSWECRATFEPKSEAVRDIRWSPLLDDSKCCCFGIVSADARDESVDAVHD